MGKKKRIIKIPLSYCKSFDDFDLNEEFDMINTYTTIVDEHKYIFDIISTKNKNFYIRVIDVTSNYKPLDFYEFKRRYCQPTLFDDFFKI